MDKKVLNSRELTQIKRIAQNVDPDYQKVCKLEKQIAALTLEKEKLQKKIDKQEVPVKDVTGGYASTDIFEKVVLPRYNEDGTPRLDKEGRPTKETKYILKYPDTILPPAKENTEDVVVPPTTENVAGNDFDLDAQSYDVNTPNL